MRKYPAVSATFPASALVDQAMSDMASALYSPFTGTTVGVHETALTSTWEIHNWVDLSTEVLVLVKETGHLVNITTEWDQDTGWTTRTLDVTAEDVATHVQENYSRWAAETASRYGHI